MASSVELSNRALTLLGAKPISSFTGIPGASIGSIYHSVVREALSIHPWAFTMRKAVKLNLETRKPSGLYEKAFTMPSDMLTGLPRAVYADYIFRTPTKDYDLDGHSILTNASSIHIDYQREVGNIGFPAHVEIYLVMALTTGFAYIITGNVAAIQAATRQRDSQLQKSIVVDSQGTPNSSITDFPLQNARLSG